MASRFTIAEVLAWAKTKPADSSYCYMDNGGCALARFLVETGRAKRPHVRGYDWRDGGGCYVSIPYKLAKALSAFPHDYGSFAKRLEPRKRKSVARPISDTWTKPNAYLTDIESVEA